MKVIKNFITLPCLLMVDLFNQISGISIPLMKLVYINQL